MNKRKHHQKKNADSYILLKNGLIVDGTGKKGWTGNLLIKGERIELVTEKNVRVTAKIIDCTGKVIAPGFIDMHSHNDWFLTSKNRPELTTPFTAQGITTSVCGNCGFSTVGIKKGSSFINMLEEENLFKEGFDRIRWNTMDDYRHLLEKNGITHNLVMLAGHGTSRASIRGKDPKPMTEAEMKEMLYLLEESMDQGARGVSLGLQYEPGIFATFDELERVARLVKKKDKILTVHAKAYSNLSGAYPLIPFGTPHNLLAIDDLVGLAEKVGMKLQISHLIFVGSKTWNTFDNAMKRIDRAVSRGIDVKFDTYAYHCGASIINVLMPPWFLARVPGSYTSRAALARLRLEFKFIERLLGFGFDDIQIAHANHTDLNRFNGMFLRDIARERGIPDFENYLDFAKMSSGVARVLMHRYSNPEIVSELMRHPASHFMTDAWIEVSGVQNPSSFGCFPRFLQNARETGILTLEDAVRKMTGVNAERFSIPARGFLGKKLAADITVFDWNKVRDNTSPSCTDASPDGIEHVFINGVQVVNKGQVKSSLRPGKVLV